MWKALKNLASGMTQLARVLAAKSDDPSLATRIHVVEGQHQLLPSCPLAIRCPLSHK